MALRLNEKYPGYMSAPTIDYPQGSFKNRSAPNVEDGSYFEKEWANDIQGLTQSLLSAAGLTANGLTDKVGASQYFDALKEVIREEAPSPDQATSTIAGIAKVSTPALLQAGVDNTSFATAAGLKNAGFWPLGVSQSWRNFTGSRLLNTTYTNTTGRTIYISVYTVSSGESYRQLEIIVGGITVARWDTSGGHDGSISAPLPSGATYMVSASGINISDVYWSELR